MNPLISLIIPVYNVEKYLNKCMESVLAQTYDNFEVLLVDDGSTDSSGKMCDEYAKRDARIFVFHKENGGLSDARNYGVERASADWVSFIDSDDWVTEDYLEYLWYLMDKYSADTSVGQFVRVNEKYKGTKEDKVKSTDRCLETENALKQLCLGGISTVACGKLYKKNIVIRDQFPKGALYEDIATTYKYIGASVLTAVGFRTVYFYRQRDSSILHGAITQRHMYGLAAAQEMCDSISAQYPRLRFITHKRCCSTALDIIIHLFESNYKDKIYYREAQDYLKRHYSFVRTLQEVSLLFKMDCIFYKSGYTIALAYHFIRGILAKIIKGGKNRC